MKAFVILLRFCCFSYAFTPHWTPSILCSLISPQFPNMHWKFLRSLSNPSQPSRWKMDADTADPSRNTASSSCISAPTFTALLGQQSRPHTGRPPITAQHGPGVDTLSLSVRNACRSRQPSCRPHGPLHSLAASSLSLKPSLVFSGLLSSLAV